MKEEVLKALEFYEIKKSKVELDLGMPKNSLSAMLAGKKEIPKKWVDVLRKYVDDLNNPQKDLVVPKEEKLPIPPSIFEPTVKSDNIYKPTTLTEQIRDYAKNDVVFQLTPVSELTQTFDQLLKQFNDLVDLTEKPKDIKLKLEQIKESAKLSNLTPRQTDSIIDRVNNFLNGQYNQAKHNLKLS